MCNITYQPFLRPALLDIKGCKDFREERALFIRIDEILTKSGIEQEFFELSAQQKDLNLEKMSGAQINQFAQICVMAFRGNIARLIKNLPHREFCKLLPDSTILRWFLGIERLDGIKAYAKSTSDRFAHWLDGESLQYINQKLIGLLANADEAQDLELHLEGELDFQKVYFDSFCLKANIHFPVDWVLLRDLTRTLMKATTLIRREGLKNRMNQDPLGFLRNMNSLVMKMTASNRVKNGKTKRKAILREMKRLAKKVSHHARKHLKLLENYGHQTSMSPNRRNHLIKRLESVLQQVGPAIKQAHERIIGERKIKNEEKILSLYEPDIDIITRGKANAAVEFGNKLWIGESRQGLIIDYLLEKDQTSDTKHVPPAIDRLTNEQNLPIKAVWGDRGLDSAANARHLQEQEIFNGLCPKNVMELRTRLKAEPLLGEGLKRRASTEARIAILVANFMGDKPRAKGFEHRQMMVGWAVLTHNLWVLARQPHKPPEEYELAA